MPIGIAGVVHVLLFAVLLPAAAIRSVGRLRERGWPAKMVLFRSILIQQAFFLVVSLVVARAEDVTIVLAPRGAGDLLIGVSGAALLAACLWPLWRHNVRQREARVLMTMPRTRGEMALWSAVSVAAGVAEELAYRGVLFALLLRVTGSPVAAAGLASVAFAVGHSVQGWRGIMVVGAIALVMHAITWFTGTLAAAILIHVIYDVLAGYGMTKLGRQYGVFDDGSPRTEPETGRAQG